MTLLCPHKYTDMVEVGYGITMAQFDIILYMNEGMKKLLMNLNRRYPVALITYFCLLKVHKLGRPKQYSQPIVQGIYDLR